MIKKVIHVKLKLFFSTLFFLVDVVVSCARTDAGHFSVDFVTNAGREEKLISRLLCFFDDYLYYLVLNFVITFIPRCWCQWANIFMLLLHGCFNVYSI